MQNNIHLSEIKLSQLILHRIGNKNEDEGVRIAKSLFDLKDDMRGILLEYFLSGFKLEEAYKFDHETDLSMNEIYTYCQYIFDDKEQFYDQSVNILKHLYEKSTHNKIKGGELYVSYFEDCVVDDELVTAIGIFKAENKDTYLKLKLDEEEEWTLVYEEGTNISKLDKGCIIFNIYGEDGYRTVTVDLKSSDAKYWRDEFLMLTQIQDDNFHTKTYLDMCKKFGKQAFEEEDKNEQVNFLNKSLDYFNRKEEFSIEEFKEEVFEENVEQAQMFENYKSDYQERQSIAEEDNFFISQPTVKKAKRSFRNAIQLDTQMEIKIHSAQAQEEGHLERGYDEDKKMNYYKVYFNTEK
ncbi:MAG: nucleoid-associated protein [Aureispira sp.]|nr:nucleoid-associated protein [Aureispira sp.]